MFNPDCYEYNTGYEHSHYDDEPVIYSGALSHIQEHLAVVLGQLYGDCQIDIGLLENSLDEVSHGLGMSLPNGGMKIQRKNKPHFSEYQIFAQASL